LKIIIKNNCCDSIPYNFKRIIWKHKSWHDAYLTCDSSINHVHSKFIFKFQKQTQGLQNWNDLELHAHELAQINSKSIWMDIFDNVVPLFHQIPLPTILELDIMILDASFA